ncbi:hypothetical protein [Acinetobacter sp. BSP-53]|jgi:hypothetical protein|uniref:hypothetical protein n=1 Tax=Acinetobacter sp. BSP-53 TaxID=3344662 RepID=UPI00376F4C79
MSEDNTDLITLEIDLTTMQLAKNAASALGYESVEKYLIMLIKEHSPQILNCECDMLK